MATAISALADPPPPSGDTLAAREMILVNQVGFARGTARWRARELYRLLQNPAGDEGHPTALAPVDRARAVVAGLNALPRDRQEEAALAKELAQTHAERAAIVEAAPASETAAAVTMAFVSPVEAGVESGFGPARDAGSGVWLFRSGLHLRARASEAVRAPEAGVVQRIADDDGGARSIVIAHAGGWVSILGGLAVEPGVAAGQAVTRGQSVGHAAGARPHDGVSWELWRHRALVDPATVVRR